MTCKLNVVYKSWNKQCYCSPTLYCSKFWSYKEVPFRWCWTRLAFQGRRYMLICAVKQLRQAKSHSNVGRWTAYQSMINRQASYLWITTWRICTFVTPFTIIQWIITVVIFCIIKVGPRTWKVFVHLLTEIRAVQAADSFMQIIVDHPHSHKVSKPLLKDLKSFK